ncbi:MAG: hypothetical protein FWD28_02015 [Treponema sp.]|nr:hypothetical protein [Treponema sp.]
MNRTMKMIRPSGKEIEAAVSPITRKLDTLLKQAGFSLLEARRVIGGQDQAVNDLAYMRGEGERVYILVHQPKATTAPGTETHEEEDTEPLHLFDVDPAGLQNMFRDFDEAMEHREQREPRRNFRLIHAEDTV